MAPRAPPLPQQKGSQVQYNQSNRLAFTLSPSVNAFCYAKGFMKASNRKRDTVFFIYRDNPL